MSIANLVTSNGTIAYSSIINVMDLKDSKFILMAV